MESMLNSGCGTMHLPALFVSFGLDGVDGAARKAVSLLVEAIRK